jgi:hypothetical protein
VNNWGEQFERPLGYFKNKDKTTPGNITELYQHFNVED